MSRKLWIVADDFGLGPGTTRGILKLGEAGLLSGTTLLVTSPHAEDAVAEWKRHRPLTLGWHPCLTMDRPLCDPATVPSLVDTRGVFLPLGTLLKRLVLKRVYRNDVQRELRAQLARYIELVGEAPRLVNGHHHIHIFEPVRSVLLDLLDATKPYLRRVTEPRHTLLRVPGVRLKRALLSAMGHASAKLQARAGFPAARQLLGVSDPPHVLDPGFFVRWLRASRGDHVELMVHPGEPDDCIGQRDGGAGAGHTERRVAEYTALQTPQFRACIEECGFTIQRFTAG